MHVWLAFPFVRYFLWLLAGILLAFLLPGYGQVAVGLLSLQSIFLLILFFYLKNNSLLNVILRGLLVFGILLSVGYWRADSFRFKALPAAEAEGDWLVKPLEPAKETARTFRFLAEVVKAEAAGKEKPVKVMVSFRKDSTVAAPTFGKHYLVNGVLNPISPPLNPHEFNYKAYLALQQVHYQLYATTSLRLNRKKAGPWAGLIEEGTKGKAYLQNVLQDKLPDQDAYAVVAAMFLGERAALDVHLRAAYADAGVMHILAVSGLHVGIIYGLLYAFLGRWQQRRWQRFTSLLILLLVLWGYAWLTGLSPSVQRATTMFSFLALGHFSKRKGNVYNFLAISAFLLLFIDPFLIAQVGFQLSYLAVLGIVYLQPRIARSYTPRYRWQKWLWASFTVTLAAQIATFPLGIYYFHQFPTYFFIANLLAVPLAGFIIPSVLGLLFLHWVPGLGTLLAYLVNFEATLLNTWVLFTQALPSSRLSATLTALELVCLFVGLVALLVLWRKRSFKWVVISFGALLLLALSFGYREFKQRQQQLLTIFHLPGHTLLNLRWGEQESLLAVGEKPSLNQLQYHVAPARLFAGFDEALKPEALPAQLPINTRQIKGVKLLGISSTTLAVVEELPKTPPAAPVPVNILLLRNNPWLKLENLPQYFSFDLLVLDGSNSWWYQQKISQEAAELQLPLHSTAANGALVYPL